MHLKLALLILAATLLAVDSAAIESSGRNITENRDPKCMNCTVHFSIINWIWFGLVMSLFSVVRFPNEFCYGTNNYNGTCLTSAECSASGGTGAGSCASGFGVCCTGNEVMMQLLNIFRSFCLFSHRFFLRINCNHEQYLLAESWFQYCLYKQRTMFNHR